ncbi:Protein of unknown function, partial [Gryllus bimaculatus]
MGILVHRQLFQTENDLFTHVRCHDVLWTFLMILLLLEGARSPFWELNAALRC